MELQTALLVAQKIMFKKEHTHVNTQKLVQVNLLENSMSERPSSVSRVERACEGKMRKIVWVFFLSELIR